MNIYDWLADLVLAAHLLFVLFVVGGQALILLGWWRRWDWPRHYYFRLVHLMAVGFVVVETWAGLVCPITWLENFLRRLSDPASGYGISFIGYWMQRLLFYNAPWWLFVLIYTLFGAIVVISYLFYAPRRRIRSH